VEARADESWQVQAKDIHDESRERYQSTKLVHQERNEPSSPYHQDPFEIMDDVESCPATGLLE
jgi:hypothetical protein